MPEVDYLFQYQITFCTYNIEKLVPTTTNNQHSGVVTFLHTQLGKSQLGSPYQPLTLLTMHSNTFPK